MFTEELFTAAVCHALCGLLNLECGLRSNPYLAHIIHLLCSNWNFTTVIIFNPCVQRIFIARINIGGKYWEKQLIPWRFIAKKKAMHNHFEIKTGVLIGERFPSVSGEFL